MSSSITHPGAEPHHGSMRATANAAAAVIALSAAIAGTALLAGIATGSAIEAPASPVDQQVEPTYHPAHPGGPVTTNRPSDTQTGGSSNGPIRAG